MLLISQFVANQICSHVTDLLSFVSLAFLCNPADFLPDYLFHLQKPKGPDHNVGNLAST